MYALKFFTKSGQARVLAMPTEKACFNILDQMRQNGCVIHIGRRCYRLDEMENVYIDDKQVFPSQLSKPIDLNAFRSR